MFFTEWQQAPILHIRHYELHTTWHDNSFLSKFLVDPLSGHIYRPSASSNLITRYGHNKKWDND